MDSMSPTYPPFPSSQSPDDAPASIGQDYPRDPAADADLSCHAPAAPGPAAPTGSLDAPVPGSQSSSPTLFPQPLQSPHQAHLYSPTRAEIEAHPIRQRLSLGGDDIAAAARSGEKREEESAASGSGTSSGRDFEVEQAQEGSERLFDAMSSEAPSVQPGDAVSYAWGGGRPGGEVTQVATNDSVTMETKRGNEVHKQGEPENPALYIARGGEHDVVKKASEVSVEEKADGNKSSEPEKKEDSTEKKADEEEKNEEPSKPAEEEKKQENGTSTSEPQTGDKRPASEPAEEKKADEPNGEAKKQKTGEEKPKENGEQPKKKGRPAKTDAAAKKDTKKRAPKKAATASGEPRRSGRVAGKSAD